MGHEIGRVARLQIHVERVKKGLKPDQYYDPAALRAMPALRLTAQGILGLTDGQEWLDVHHVDHPDSKSREGHAISFNFQSHYTRIQERFGPHVAIGCGAENILIAADLYFDLPTLAGGLVIETRSGLAVHLAQIELDHPCLPFTKYLLDLSGPGREVDKETLRFLDDGTRGFYGVWAGEAVEVRVGDRVLIDA